LYSDAVDDSAITSSSEDANFPDDNVATNSLIQVWRAGSVATEWVRVDAGSSNTITADAVCIAGHNFTSSVSVILRAASTTTALSAAPTTSAAVTYRSGVMAGYFTSNTERYWQLDISDSSNGDGFVSVGRLFIGEYLQMDPSSYDEVSIGKVRTDRAYYSITNQVYGDVGTEHYELSYKFPRTTATARTNIETFYGSVGLTQPFFFMNFDTEFSVLPPLYVTLTSDIIFKYHAGNWFDDYVLNMREVG
jgi:hypothetical protein